MPGVRQNCRVKVRFIENQSKRWINSSEGLSGDTDGCIAASVPPAVQLHLVEAEPGVQVIMGCLGFRGGVVSRVRVLLTPGISSLLVQLTPRGAASPSRHSCRPEEPS